MWFEDGELKIHLGVDPDFPPARKAHPAILVLGLQALAQHLREAGVEVVDDDSLPGYNRVYVTDPFGNRLERTEASR